jgi:hypothetical protein
MAQFCRRFRSPVTSLGLACLILCALAGCVRESTTGDRTVFSYQWWIPLTVVLVGAAAGYCGWQLREKDERWAYGLMIAGGLSPLIALSLFTDGIAVDPIGFSGKGGFFGSKSYVAKFDDITDFILVTQRGRRSSSDKIIFHTRDGMQDEFVLGDSMTQSAARLILTIAERKGIPIKDQRQ